MIKNNIVEARRFAREKHKSIIITTKSGDVRPQIEHLQEVADLVWASGGTDNEIAAAWLHDSVEDTSTTLIEIQEKFGEHVSNLVGALTDSNELKGLSNIDRKTLQAQRISDKNPSVKTIKLADQISNIRFFTTDPKPKWTFEEKRDYIIGAKLIADQCKNINPILDKLFETEYQKATLYFKIS